MLWLRQGNEAQIPSHPHPHPGSSPPKGPHMPPGRTVWKPQTWERGLKSRSPVKGMPNLASYCCSEQNFTPPPLGARAGGPQCLVSGSPNNMPKSRKAEQRRTLQLALDAKENARELTKTHRPGHSSPSKHWKQPQSPCSEQLSPVPECDCAQQ